jgi:hypothetical protein
MTPFCFCLLRQTVCAGLSIESQIEFTMRRSYSCCAPVVMIELVRRSILLVDFTCINRVTEV